MTEKQNQLALLKKDTVDVVAQRVRQFQESGEIHLPANYSAENAMKAAWLILQGTVDKDKRPVLEVCTRDSIANSLLDMVVQGLNPMKKQGYFIAYGKQLTFQRSYHGTQAVAKQVAGVKDVFAQVVYEGDEFEYEIVLGKKRVTKHVQKIENVRGDKILAAYCIVVFADGGDYADIMTWEQIQKAWAKSKMNPNAADSTHKMYPEEMARRTIINRTCKPLINSSSDSHLFLQSFHRADDIQAEDELAAEIEEHANATVIDVTAEQVDAETGEVMAPGTTEPPATEPEAPKAPAGKAEQQTLAPTGTNGQPDF